MSVTGIGVTKKADLTVRVEDMYVVVVNGDNKKGGNVLSKGNQKVRFFNETTGTCRLIFKSLLPADTTGPDPDGWPFSSPVEPTGAKELSITAGNDITCTLKAVDADQYFKYDVVVDLAGVHSLDPVIIVRPASA